MKESIARATADECRPGCGACCIAPSISSAIPGMPDGKPAGVRCVQLDADNLCRLFGDPRRPAVCARFGFDRELCGEHRDQALERIAALELAT
ncbi:YkgJ family cysteine cluster protein [Halomonas heilongjiangensis]|uniref:Zinc/iron-chelating domain-containing protein n=1 Tax=Halomonas heilongjiangensis TaxID=1387883 RepID=A0A2N7TIH1_9GAMM|nr:YkgJ family cysteine cluster protein [Halomonas heilongjiangensis]PMR67958.1 zinc/iron-chelating domain-containing protein [Halomonas heilongjiangensis]PXX90504.1 zinc/iron-chelating domain-containing protein [Halomonas heilongjiangensis]